MDMETGSSQQPTPFFIALSQLEKLSQRSQPHDMQPSLVPLSIGRLHASLSPKQEALQPPLHIQGARLNSALDFLIS